MPESIVGDVTELVGASTLEGIDVYLLEAKRDLGASANESSEIAPDYTLFIDFKDDGQGFRVRFETRIDVGIGSVACGVLVSYTHEGFVLREESGTALTEFVNGVALMHVLPYVRQSIADLTTRVFGTALLMPIIQRGEISFQLNLAGIEGR